MFGTFVWRVVRAIQNSTQAVRRAHLVNIVTGSSGHVPLIPDPMLFGLHLPAALNDRVPRQLAHVRWGQLVDLRSTAVFLQ